MAKAILRERKCVTTHTLHTTKRFIAMNVALNPTANREASISISPLICREIPLWYGVLIHDEMHAYPWPLWRWRGFYFADDLRKRHYYWPLQRLKCFHLSCHTEAQICLRETSSGFHKWGRGLEGSEFLAGACAPNCLLPAARRAKTQAHPRSNRVAGCSGHLVRPWSIGLRSVTEHMPGRMALAGGSDEHRELEISSAFLLLTWFCGVSRVFRNSLLALL